MVVEYKILVTLLRLLFQEIKEGLKGVCHEIFDYYVFHDLNPSGPLINRESNFEFGFDFAEIFHHKVLKLRGAHDTAESKFLVK